MLNSSRLIRCFCGRVTGQSLPAKAVAAAWGPSRRVGSYTSPCSQSSTQVGGQINNRYTETNEKNALLDDPFLVVEQELNDISAEIKKKLPPEGKILNESTHYYFNHRGKYIRPSSVLLLARAVNMHQRQQSDTTTGQREIALICEMIHNSSLLQDDVIDNATLRRRAISVNLKFGDKMSILAGNYVMSSASKAITSIGNTDVTLMLTQVILDLIQGELLQLTTQSDPNQFFERYLEKTYKKTCSLFVHCFKSVAVLEGCDKEVQNACFNFGKYLGYCFQLIDDALDVAATSEEIGKGVGRDLQFGLATAPVLLALNKFPELQSLISRRFQESGDIERATELIEKADGVQQTRLLAKEYADTALSHLNVLRASVERESLAHLVNIIVNRTK